MKRRFELPAEAQGVVFVKPDGWSLRLLSTLLHVVNKFKSSGFDAGLSRHTLYSPQQSQHSSTHTITTVVSPSERQSI
jgi:hypothetical protein